MPGVMPNNKAKSKKERDRRALNEHAEDKLGIGKSMPAPSGSFDNSAKARALRSMGAVDEKPKVKKKKQQKEEVEEVEDQDNLLAIEDSSPMAENDDGSGDGSDDDDWAFWIEEAKKLKAKEKIEDSSALVEDVGSSDEEEPSEKKKSRKPKKEKKSKSERQREEFPQPAEKALKPKKSKKKKPEKIESESESDDGTEVETAVELWKDKSSQPVDMEKWKLSEQKFSGSITFETLGRKEEVRGKSIPKGIENFQANPGKYVAMTYQTNNLDLHPDQHKYSYIHRDGTKQYRPQGVSEKGWMTLLMQEYERLPRFKNNVLPEEYRDEYTDNMIHGGYKLHSIHNPPILPGRGMGIGDSPELKIIGDVDPSDIEQGSVGDCWLLSGISSLAEFDGAIKHLFRKTNNLDKMPFDDKPNMYTITLWDLPTWKEVDIEVDERLCVKADGSGDLLAAQPSTDNELWVCYLEKALAIHCGGWDKISGGQCTHAWSLMTGCKEQYQIRKNEKTGKYMCMAKYNPYEEKWMPHCNSSHDGEGRVYQVAWPEVGGGGDKEKELTEDELFLKLCAWDKVNYIVGAGTTGSSDKNRTDGMVDNHAYSVIESYDNVAGTGFGLLKVRNPWGRGEIEDGMFDDDGPGWDKYPEIKKALKPVVADDGIFWVTKQEFFEYFQTIYLSASSMTEFLED